MLGSVLPILVALFQPGPAPAECPQLAQQVKSPPLRAAMLQAIPRGRGCGGLKEVRALTVREPVHGLAGIEQAPNLEVLSLRDVVGGDLAPLAKLPRLKALAIGPPTWELIFEAQVHVTDLAPLAAVSTLERLTIRSARLESLTPLKRASALKALDLEGSEVPALDGLDGCVALRTLNLDGAGIRDVSPLAGLRSLESLNLAGNRVGDLTPLAGLPALTTLDVSFNPRLTDLTPLGGAKRLERIQANMSGVHTITGLLKLTRLLEVNVCNTPIAKQKSSIQRLAADGVRVRALGPSCSK